MTNKQARDVRAVVEPAEVKRFDRMLADEHWLGRRETRGTPEMDRAKSPLERLHMNPGEAIRLVTGPPVKE